MTAVRVASLLLVLSSPLIISSYQRWRAAAAVRESTASLPAPTVPSSSPSPSAHFLSSPHLFTRLLYHLLPLSLQHWLRDVGFLRVFDGPTLALGAVFLLLTRPAQLLRIVRPPAGVHTDLHYGPSRCHKLDVYASHRVMDACDRLSPVVVFVHGGAWGSGSKLLYSLLGQCLDARLRCVAVLPNYSLYPAGSISDQCDDLHRALQWTAANIAHYGGDAARIALAGHSSGAHVAALYLLSTAASARVPVCGLLGLSGVYDVALHFEHERRRGVHEVSPMRPVMGGRPRFALTSPTCIALSRGSVEDGWSGSVLLLHGDRDQTVPDEQSRDFALALGGRLRMLKVDVDGRPVSRPAADRLGLEDDAATRGEGCRCECVIYADGDHVSTVLPLMTQSGRHLIAEIQRFVTELTEDERVDSTLRVSEPTASAPGTKLPSRL